MSKPLEALVDGHLIEIKSHGASADEWKLIIDNESVDRKKKMQVSLDPLLEVSITGVEE